MIAEGCMDINIRLLVNLKKFIENDCMVGFVLCGMWQGIGTRTFPNGCEGGF